MTMYGSEYDGSDHGEAKESRCYCCDAWEAFYDDGDYLCEDCLEEKYFHDIEAVAVPYIRSKGMRGDFAHAEYELMQVTLVKSAKNQDFIGFNLSFDNIEDVEVSLMEIAKQIKED